MLRHTKTAQPAVSITLSPLAEDYLERLYMRDVEGEGAELALPDDRVLGELLRHQIARHEGGAMRLTSAGRVHAEGAVRRHRLAERLLHDVMHVHGDRVDAAACEFEHSLHHGIDEHICTLLGHPKTCPHGRVIPPGHCCRERKGAATAVIVSLAEMKSGDCGAIAYLSSYQPETMQKLMALGVLPGSPIAVIQTFPSVVFQVNQTQIALDTPLAGDIYVRRVTGDK